MENMSTESKELLSNKDLRVLFVKLMLLNSYEKETLFKTKERLQFWESRAIECGSDSIADELRNRTYSDIINNTLKQISNIENEISENNLLIDKIKSILNID